MDQTILDYVGNANHIQINELLFELMKRYKALRPDYEVYMFTIPKEDGDERE